MNKVGGYSLIELVSSIVIIGVIAIGILAGINQVLRTISVAHSSLQATNLATARMNVILAVRQDQGFTALNDPCLLSTPPALCTTLLNFANNNNFSVSTHLSTTGEQTDIDVTVSGTHNASLHSRVFNYDNS